MHKIRRLEDARSSNEGCNIRNKLDDRGDQARKRKIELQAEGDRHGQAVFCDTCSEGLAEQTMSGGQTGTDRRRTRTIATMMLTIWPTSDPATLTLTSTSPRRVTAALMAVQMAPAATDGLVTPSATILRLDLGRAGARLTEGADADVDGGLEVDQNLEDGGLIAP